MSEDFTFSMMIDSPLSELQLMRLLLEGLVEARSTGGYIEYRQNVLKIDRNSLHDAGKASHSNDSSWMYYPYSLNAFPKGDTTVAQQRAVAHDVLAALGKAGIKPEFVSEFEL
jgi:hypothetical protein